MSEALPVLNAILAELKETNTLLRLIYFSTPAAQEPQQALPADLLPEIETPRDPSPIQIQPGFIPTPIGINTFWAPEDLEGRKLQRWYFQFFSQFNIERGRLFINKPNRMNQSIPTLAIMYLVRPQRYYTSRWPTERPVIKDIDELNRWAYEHRHLSADYMKALFAFNMDEYFETNPTITPSRRDGLLQRNIMRHWSFVFTFD